MELGALLPSTARVTKEDLQANLSAGIIIHSQFGSLIKLREALAKLFPDSFQYFTISGEPLYLVHFNDLNEQKQKKVGGCRR